MSDRVCLKCSGLSYADWRRGRNEAPPCQRCGRRDVAVRVIRTAGGAEVTSGEPVGRDRGDDNVTDVVVAAQAGLALVRVRGAVGRTGEPWGAGGRPCMSESAGRSIRR